MTTVIDAGLVVAALVDSGPTGIWAGQLLGVDDLAAPHLMPVEVANTLRRAAMAGDLSSDTASMAHVDLMELRVALYPYQPFASRIWDLRSNVTAYDAWYVSLAESLSSPLATLDLRLSQAAGCECRFVTPP